MKFCQTPPQNFFSHSIIFLNFKNFKEMFLKNASALKNTRESKSFYEKDWEISNKKSTLNFFILQLINNPF